MSYLFTCPHCQTQTLVDEQYSGQAGECVMCGRAIQLPTFGSGSEQGSVSVTSTRRVPTGHSTRSPLRWVVASTVGLVLLVAIALIIVRYGSDGIKSMQANRLRGQCIRNLETIAIALRSYAQDYGSLPPPATMSEDGTTPLLSWRVLILPYLGERELYDEFHLNEPWSSTHNQSLTFRMPEVFRSPAAISVNGFESHYSLVVGTGTLFPSTGPLRLADIADGWDKTILVVEVASPTSLSTQWIEPGEFDVSGIVNPIGQNMGRSIGGNHEQGATIVTADGRGHFLPQTLDPVVLQALVTPSGSEGINDDVLD